MKFRPIDESERKTVASWIAEDQDHSGKVTSDYWVSPPDTVQTWAVDDDEGTLFYVRAENILRLHIQFPPEKTKRLVRGISEFSEQMQVIAGAKSYKQIIFDSVSKTLIRFLEKRGFKHSPNEYISETKEPEHESTPPDEAGQTAVREVVGEGRTS